MWYVNLYGKKKRKPIHVIGCGCCTWYIRQEYPEKYRHRLIRKARELCPFDASQRVIDMLLRPNFESIRRRDEFLSDLKDLNVDLSNGEITATMEDL